MLKRPYFVRLVLFCICISLIPMLVLGYSLSNKASGSIQRKVDEANAHILYQKRQQVEQVVNMTNQLSTQLATSSLVYEVLPRKLEPIDFRDIESVKQAMGNMISLESSIRDVYFVNLEQLWSISNEGWMRYDGIEQMSPLMRYRNPALPSYWVVPAATDYFFGKEVVLLVKNLPVNSSRPQGLLIVVLSLHSLAKLIDESGLASRSMILDADGRLIAGDDTNVGQVMAIRNWENEVDAYRSDRGTFMQKGSRFVVQRQQSLMNSWQYVTVTSIREATRDARDMLWFTALLFAVLVMVVIVLAFMGSNSMYRPIRQIVVLFKGGERNFSFERRSDEVAYIYDRIQIQSNQLNEFFMTKLCQGLVHQSQIRQRLAEHGIPSDAWSRLITVVIQIDTLLDTRFEEKDRDLLLFAINNIVNDIIAKEDCLIPVVMGVSQVTVFTDIQQEEALFRDKVDGYLQGIHRAVRNVLGITVSMGVSRIFAGPESITRSYQEGVEALQYRLSLGGNAILYIQDVEVIDNRRNGYPFEEAECMINAVKTVEPIDVIQNRLDAVVDNIFLESNSARVQQLYLGQLVFDLIGLMQKTGEPLTPQLRATDSFLTALFRMSSKEEVRNRLLEMMIKPTLDALIQRRNQQYQSIVERIAGMIEQEYSQNITLEACADRLNYHPDYVGRVFRKEMGAGFAEYLSGYRLKIAKQLLKNTDLKISEISCQVGYSNPQNFIRHFRKNEDMTPGAYRDKHT